MPPAGFHEGENCRYARPGFRAAYVDPVLPSHRHRPHRFPHGLLTVEWPVSRLAEVRNKLPIDGLKPVKQFMDRKTAVARIWADIRNVARESSKKSIILVMLRRPGGATLGQIIEATGWQPHTVRAFISGAIGEQLGLKVKSTRTETGERRHRITA